MTAIRQVQDHVLESSDSSDSSSNNNNDSAITTNPLNLYKPGCLKYNDFVNKLDTYNNNQLLLPTQFYKTLLAKAVLSSSSDDKANVYKNMLFPKDRDFEQVVVVYCVCLSGMVVLIRVRFCSRRRSAGMVPSRGVVRVVPKGAV